MKSRYWIKLYLEILDDLKMWKLPNHLWRRTIELFLLAGENGDDGALRPVEEISWRLRIPETVLAEDLLGLAEVGVVHEAEPGKWVVTNFQKRQMRESGAERTQHYRKHMCDDMSQVLKHNGDEVVTSVSTLSPLISSESLSDSESESEGEGVGGGTALSTTHAPADCDEPCLSPLSTAFVNATRIPELTGGPPRWITALETMQKAGVEPIDVTNAVQELRDRDYSITTLSSIVNPAISAMSKRKTGGKKKHPDDCECETCLNKYKAWENI